MNNKIVKSLADFKRYLTNGGAIRLIEVYGEYPAPKLQGIRKADKVQTNAVRFEGGSWLYFPTASLIEFTSDERIKIYDEFTESETGAPMPKGNKQRGQVSLVYQLID